VAAYTYFIHALQFNGCRSFIFESASERASFEVSIVSGNFTSTALEFINGIRTVQAFATQDFERKRYYKLVLIL
jgi:ABC-type multidrug transport system fused ATPase/permease subunit